ncbi:MAG: family 10 glycosylhydrolase, partial [Verrucomicrobiales bacterium]
MSIHPFLFVLALGCVTGVSAEDAPAGPVNSAKDNGDSTPRPPDPMREFRGVWITTIHNVDWPSREDLPEAKQKAELITILDRCADLQLNAVVLQVRSGCDALYPSDLEPWCPWLTGTMGKSPGYDPLQFAIEAAHERGLELHAWFNPFRAVNSKFVPVSKGHISRTNPEYTCRYGDKVWLDPAFSVVRERALNVVRDVLKRYDVDAIHLDDYFYPYPVKVGDSYKDFNDSKTWSAYTESGGTLSRGDWRRKHVNDFVSKLHTLVREEKPTCKFGISPFGIYRPGQPVQVKA